MTTINPADLFEIDSRDRLDELANRRASTSNWTAVVVDRQGDVFGTYLGNRTWHELGSAAPFCLSGRIALPARLVAGQARRLCIAASDIGADREHGGRIVHKRPDCPEHDDLAARPDMKER